eukprot:46623_1
MQHKLRKYRGPKNRGRIKFNKFHFTNYEFQILENNAHEQIYYNKQTKQNKNHKQHPKTYKPIPDNENNNQSNLTTKQLESNTDTPPNEEEKYDYNTDTIVVNSDANTDDMKYSMEHNEQKLPLQIDIHKEEVKYDYEEKMLIVDDMEHKEIKQTDIDLVVDYAFSTFIDKNLKAEFKTKLRKILENIVNTKIKNNWPSKNVLDNIVDENVKNGTKYFTKCMLEECELVKWE